MDEARQARRLLDAGELAARYAAIALVAAAGAVVGAVGVVGLLRETHLGCQATPASNGSSAGVTYACPDGVGYLIPSLVGGFTMAAVVIALAVFFIGRRTQAATIERMTDHLLWLIFAAFLIPSLGWLVLALLNRGSAYGLLGLIPVALTALPLVTAYRRRKALPRVLAICLLGPVVVMAFWQALVLLVPLAVLLAEGWGIALWLSLWAVRLRREGPSGRLPKPGLSS